MWSVVFSPDFFQSFSDRFTISLDGIRVKLPRAVKQFSPMLSQGLTRSEATQIIDAVIACVENALIRGEDVRLSGFCSMTVKDRPAKNYRNNTTGEIVIGKSKEIKNLNANGL